MIQIKSGSLMCIKPYRTDRVIVFRNMNPECAMQAKDIMVEGQIGRAHV